MSARGQLDMQGLRLELAELAHRAAEQQATVDLRLFLPLEGHARALRPDIAIIRGGRGAGKTALFQALSRCKDADERRAFFGASAIPEKLVWVDGFSEDVKHAHVGVLDSFARTADDTALRAFWQRHLAKRLADSLPSDEGSSRPIAPADLSSIDPNEMQILDTAALTRLARYLDELDKALAREGRYLYVAYDNLDRVGQWDREVRQRYVSTLLSLWLSLGARFRAIRPKIFLREDLLMHAETRFSDASKMRGQSVNLDWSVEDLFRVAVRHMAATQGLRTWLGHEVPGLVTEEPVRGVIPGRMPDEVRDRFATALVGRLMGAGVKKGFTYRWIANHLQDGNVRVVPRSFLVLLGTAAQHALNSAGSSERILSPGNLVDALRQTSLARVSELREEFPIVERLRHLEDSVLFLDESNVRRLIGKPISVEDTSTQDGASVVEALVEIGVLVRRKPDKIDVPDLFRYGFNIKRKGGVAKPK